MEYAFPPEVQFDGLTHRVMHHLAAYGAIERGWVRGFGGHRQARHSDVRRANY